MTKEWLFARLKEGSTKYGVAVLIGLAALVLSTDDVGGFSTRLDGILAAIAALRLITTQEAPKAPADGVSQ